MLMRQWYESGGEACEILRGTRVSDSQSTRTRLFRALQQHACSKPREVAMTPMDLLQ